MPVRLKPLPEPDYLDISVACGSVALLTDDGTSSTSQLAQALASEGWNVIVLSFPISAVAARAFLPSGVTRVELQDLGEGHLKQQLAAISSTYGAIGCFIHLHPAGLAHHSESIGYSNVDKAIVKFVFLMAKHLKQALLASAKAGYGCFCTIARLDGAFGLEKRMGFNTISSGLFGLTKSLNQEWEPVFCRAVDLSAELDDSKLPSYVLAELHDPDRRITEVGYGARGRVKLTVD